MSIKCDVPAPTAPHVGDRIADPSVSDEQKTLIIPELSPWSGGPIAPELAGAEAVFAGVLTPEHDRRMARWTQARRAALRMGGWLTGQRRHRLGAALAACGSWLNFRVSDGGVTQAARGYFCQLHKLCPICAIRRGSRMLAILGDKIGRRMADHPGLLPYLVTFTRRHVHDDWLPAIGGVRTALRRLMDRRRQHACRGIGRTEASAAKGLYHTMEITRGERSGKPHPHVHAIWLCEEPPNADLLRAEWYDITGDSDQVDVRPLHSVVAAQAAGTAPTSRALTADLVEVCKYLTKFTSMNPTDVLHLHEHTARMRFTATAGVLRFDAAERAVIEGEREARRAAPGVDVPYRWDSAAEAYVEADDIPEAGERPAAAREVRDRATTRSAAHQRGQLAERMRRPAPEPITLP